MPIRLADMNVRAVTSADYSKCEPVDTEDALLQQIDRTAQKTLADCMQLCCVIIMSTQGIRIPWMNSSCHAWSCSASYFIRKYFV